MPPIDYDAVAEWYDAYVTVDADVPFFKSEAARVTGPIIELTSGTGRLSVPLAESVTDLTCVDLSQGMLNVLSRKLAERGLHAEVHCADVCELELPRRFDLAILPFQSFMEIVGAERQRSALAAVFRLLQPGGRFICTMHNPAVRRLQVDGVHRLIGRFPFKEGSLVVSGFEQGGRPIVSRIQFFEFFDSAGRLISKHLLPMQFEMVEHDAFEAMANEAGFRVNALYGNYERAPFDADNSPVMVWVLEKPTGRGSE